MEKESLLKTKLLNQNKGQKEMVEGFVNGIITNGNAPIPFLKL